MPLPKPARDYLLKALDGTPVVLSTILADRADSDPIWDFRPDPNRFTLREALAHLADWEPIWVDRIQQTMDGNRPFLPNIDEGRLAVDRNYAASSPNGSIARIREGRSQVTSLLETVPDDAWDLTCDREQVGELTLQQLAYYVLAHDAYHLRQAAEWLGHKN